MKTKRKYKLKRDLPTFRVGQIFYISPYGGLWLDEGLDNEGEPKSTVCAYSSRTLEKFPNILKGWFEEIIEEPAVEISGQFKPKKGVTYFSVYSGCASPYSNCTQSLTDSAIEIGLSFKTEEECQKWIEKMKAYQILRQDTKGFKPDWKNYEQEKWSAYYDYENGEFHSVVSYGCLIIGDIYFATADDARASIKAHRKEWLTVMGVEE